MRTLFIYDCRTGEISLSRTYPVQVGSSLSSPLRVRMSGDAGVFVATGPTGLSFYVQTKGGMAGEANGRPIDNVYPIEPMKDRMLVVGDGMFIAYWTEDETSAGALMAQYERGKWFLYETATGEWKGPFAQAAIAADPDIERRFAWASLAGVRKGICSINALKRLIQDSVPSTMYAMEEAGQLSPSLPEQSNAEEEETLDGSSGRYTCPVCWLKFDAGNVLSIASHPDLMGDPVLGRDQMLRFLAKRFNTLGQALDEKGVPCPDIACPFCRCKLPPAFLESREHVFSIIGAPAAGKSYYLASLVHEMENNLARKFSAAWRDADPTGNSMLNDVTYRLFNSNTPEEAYLSKTDLEGALYSEFHRHGRLVKLPKPFVYAVSSLKDSTKITSLIFYDNAGEHFEPGRNSEESPGAQHVSIADGLFFLFDPTTSAPFRRKIGENADPQLVADAPKRVDQQNIIMTETAVRISTILNLSPGQKIDKPLAIMLGKSDLWLDKLDEKLQSIYTDDGRVDHEKVDANSEILRRLMMELHPSLCTTAETLSTCVRYFAVSPLGCSPVEFMDAASNSTKIGPDPRKIAPQRVCDPTLWVLSLLEPDIIPFI